MTRVYPMLLTFISFTMLSVTQTRATDTPANLRKDIDAAIAKYEEAHSVASERLLEAFDKQAATIAKSTKLKSEDKDSVIATIDLEKANFQKFGTLPFSPAMRASAVAYLNELFEAKSKTEKPFDKAIVYHRTKTRLRPMT